MNDLPSLRIDDFDAFLRDVHGYQATSPGEAKGPGAFPWQRELLERAMTDDWPDVIDVPTGLGKTAVIDVAVFALALQADLPPGERTARLRTFVLVDRRLVVDQITDHAKRLRAALSPSADRRPSPICAAVGERLQSLTVPDNGSHDPLGSSDEPLVVTRMRGGTTWDARWLARPDQPAVVVGTVDQLGSRLLFRGYGVSDRSLPIDAALVGTDALLVLDEAHLSEPARQTIVASLCHDRAATDHPLQHRRPRLVTMSATPHRGPEATCLDFDLDAHMSIPDCARRLRSRKPTALWEIADLPANPIKAIERVGQALAHAAEVVAATVEPIDGSTPVIAVVANTVRAARAAYTVLDAAGANTVLLTGRSREVDRGWLNDSILEQAAADRPRPPMNGDAQAGSSHPGPFVLVATQTIEVGVDIDVDALVTEAAPLDALAQRLGRLDRRGHRTAARSAGLAVVLHAPRLHADDLIYRSTETSVSPITTTWALLCRAAGAAPTAFRTKSIPSTAEPTGSLDLGPLALRALIGNEPGPRPFDTPRLNAPVLTPEHLGAWARTSPKPRADTDIEPFLHGRDDTTAPVRIMWRADVTTTDASEPDDRRALITQVTHSLEALPPHDSEIVEVPVTEARRWLLGEPTGALADVEPPVSPAEDAAPAPAAAHHHVAAVRPDSRGGFTVEIVSGPSAVRPGRLLVASTRIGGLDRFGWKPELPGPVLDVADLCERRNGNRVRLSARVAEQFASDGDAGLVAQIENVLADLQQARRENAGSKEIDRLLKVGLKRYAELLATAAATAHPADAASMLKSRITGLLENGFQTIRQPARCWTVAAAPDRPTATGVLFRDDSDDSSSLTAPGTSVPTLAAHLDDVRDRTRAFALRVGCPPALAEATALAARAHDLGKLDPRFQQMLHGGEPLWPTGEPPIAKSGLRHEQWRQSARRAGWPAGLRHEALSVALVKHYLRTTSCEQGPAIDTSLVRHLVGAHHGYGRPLFPPVTSTGVPIKGELNNVALEIDEHEATAASQHWDSPARFARLTHRYSPWGLALLETIVRLADMNCSEAGR